MMVGEGGGVLAGHSMVVSTHTVTEVPEMAVTCSRLRC